MDDGKIFKVDTVPPPPGESDAYNAPTRIGSINADEWQALMNAHESVGGESPASPRPRGEPEPVSNRPRAQGNEARSFLSEIPPPPLPATVPRLYCEDDNGDDEEAVGAELAWPALGAAALTAVQEVQRASLTTVPPAARPSAFPEWVAGTNVQEKMALEAARRRKIRTWIRAGFVVAVAVAAVITLTLRH